MFFYLFFRSLNDYLFFFKYVFFVFQISLKLPQFFFFGKDSLDPVTVSSIEKVGFCIFELRLATKCNHIDPI